MEATVCRRVSGIPLLTPPSSPHQFPWGQIPNKWHRPPPLRLCSSGAPGLRHPGGHVGAGPISRAWLSALPIPRAPWTSRHTERGPFPTAALLRTSSGPRHVPCRWSVHWAWRLPFPGCSPGAEVHAPYKGWLEASPRPGGLLGLSHR